MPDNLELYIMRTFMGSKDDDMHLIVFILSFVCSISRFPVGGHIFYGTLLLLSIRILCVALFSGYCFNFSLVPRSSKKRVDNLYAVVSRIANN